MYLKFSKQLGGYVLIKCLLRPQISEDEMFD